MNDYANAISILRNNHWYKPNGHVWHNHTNTEFVNEMALMSDPKAAISKAGLDWDFEMQRINSSYQVPANSITKKYGIPYVESWDDADNYTTEVMPKGCSHEWLDYIGLNQRYKYCKKCDEKKQ